MDNGTIDFLRAIEWFEPCPACWKPIDIIAMADGIGGIENRRGKMAVGHACPHCGAKLRCNYIIEDGIPKFDYFETA